MAKQQMPLIKSLEVRPHWKSGGGGGSLTKQLRCMCMFFVDPIFGVLEIGAFVCLMWFFLGFRTVSIGCFRLVGFHVQTVICWMHFWVQLLSSDRRTDQDPKKGPSWRTLGLTAEC